MKELQYLTSLDVNKILAIHPQLLTIMLINKYYYLTTYLDHYTVPAWTCCVLELPSYWVSLKRVDWLGGVKIITGIKNRYYYSYSNSKVVHTF